MKIIVVDDEILVRKGITKSIDWGQIGVNHVFEASNGEQALDLILKNDIDIVLTDIKMPKMDGVELIEQLKVVRPSTVVIVLSCINDMEYMRKALSFGGAIDYIPKLSMTTEELLDIIKRAREYVRGSKEPEIQSYTNLPSFFTLEYEERLRDYIEYGTFKNVETLLDEIFEQAKLLGVKWRNSREWNDMISLFSSIVKKYNKTIDEFFPKNITFEQVFQTIQDIESLKKYMLEVIINIKRFIKHEKKISYDEHIEKAIYYINNNYNRNIRLKDVARYVNISETYLSRLFKRVMKVNFIDYINTIKIEKSKELLQTRKYTIQQVSEKMGYNNSSYFTQIFREIEGVTPKQYQQNYDIGFK